MNEIIKEYKIPGHKTFTVIVPRSGSRKQKATNALQLELNFKSDL
ncbi:hypothetical protein [Sutcliffiella horikoshii]|nr:hypothetical protein [Sutcliffiella horikoshii]